MTRHFGTRPSAQPKGEWLRLSHEFTWVVEDFSGRDDLVVKISPDAGYDDNAYDGDGKIRKGAEQHPGVTFPRLGVIEINGKYMPDGLDLKKVHPLRYGNRNDYPAIWGLLAHEAAHARDTLWLEEIVERQERGELTEDEQHWAGAAVLLEEPRIERSQIDFRPQDQPWLAAAATAITLKEVGEELARPAPDGLHKPAVARMALLTLGRVDAGSIDPSDDTAKLEKLARDTFGKDYDKMRQIWREALGTEDDDAEGMLDLGRRWYELTGDDGGQGDEGQEGQGAPGALGKALQDMMGTLSEMAADAQGEATGANRAKERRGRLEKAERDRRTENAKNEQAKERASKVFHASPDRNSTAGRGSPVSGYRDPTAVEMGLARRTQRALMNAYTPERAVSVITSALPPGRLSARAAQQGRAQRVMGLPPTTEPFTRKDRKRIPVPPLKVAIAQDVSGSQDSAAAAAASGAWALAKATEGIMDAQVAMVTFGDAVHSVIGPREKLPRVPVLRTPSGSHHLHEALEALEGVLDLMRGGSARLLVILTDGYHEREQLQMRDPDLLRLAKAGVKILWLVTDGRSYGDRDGYVPELRHPNIRVHDKASGQYGQMPSVITTEAVNALKQ